MPPSLQLRRHRCTAISVPVPPGSPRHTGAPQPRQLRCPRGYRCPQGCPTAYRYPPAPAAPGSRYPPAPSAPGSRCPPPTSAPRSPRYRCPLSPGGSGVPVRPSSGARQPPDPAAHPGRMVPAQCRQRGAARLGAARGAGRGGPGRGGAAWAGGRAGAPGPGFSPPPAPLAGLARPPGSCSREGSGPPPRGVGAPRQPQRSRCAGGTARLPEAHPLPRAPGSALAPKGHRQPGPAPALPAPPSPWVSAHRPGQVLKKGVSQRAELIPSPLLYPNHRGHRAGRGAPMWVPHALLSWPFPTPGASHPSPLHGEPHEPPLPPGCSCPEPGPAQQDGGPGGPCAPSWDGPCWGGLEHQSLGSSAPHLAFPMQGKELKLALPPASTSSPYPSFHRSPAPAPWRAG